MMMNERERKIMKEAGVVRPGKSRACAGVINKQQRGIALWDAIYDSAMADKKLYGDFLAMVYSDMADATDDADFLDPILKYADIVDAALWVKAFVLWGKRCVDAGTVHIS